MSVITFMCFFVAMTSQNICSKKIPTHVGTQTRLSTSWLCNVMCDIQHLINCLIVVWFDVWISAGGDRNICVVTGHLQFLVEVSVSQLMAKIKTPWFNFVGGDDVRVSRYTVVWEWRLSYWTVMNSTIFVLLKIDTLKFMSQVSCCLFNQKENAFCCDYFKGPWTDNAYINCVITYTVKLRFYFLRRLPHHEASSPCIHVCQVFLSYCQELKKEKAARLNQEV